MRRNAPTAAVAALCVVVLAAVSGCRSGGLATAPPANARVGSSDQTIQVGGLARTFRLYRPATLPAAAPLVVMLHGGFGSGIQAEKAYGWDVEAEREHFLVVYPDGVNHAWNTGGGCCGTPAKQGIDDVAFLQAVVATVEARPPVDPGRIYATGISNGGIMAYRLACDTDLFAAIGPDSATLLGPLPLARAGVGAPHPRHRRHPHPLRRRRGRRRGAHRRPAGRAGRRGLARDRRLRNPAVAESAAKSGTLTTTTAQCPDGRTVELIAITGAGAPVAGEPAAPGRGGAAGRGPALVGAERDRHLLALLRCAPEAPDVTARGPRPDAPCRARPG